MEYIIGFMLALAVFASATVIGFDRERALYPVVMMVIASYYVLFAAMDASGWVLIMECLAGGVFAAAAVISFKVRLWLVVAALAGHGVFDLVHHDLVGNPGVPPWWPGFCLAFDVAAAGYLAVLLMKRPGLDSRVATRVMPRSAADRTDDARGV
jgi:hypothetical protein